VGLYAARRRRNRIATGFALVATMFGLGWLVVILVALLWNGFSGLSSAVFTQMTPPPGSDGGLLNPIIGSLILTALAVMMGTPLGILAGTYMAEYGRHARLTTIVRFINDILLSAPSIVVGLFIYEVMVAPLGHFSAIAGAVALAVVVVRVMAAGAQSAARGGRRPGNASGCRRHPRRLPGGTRRHDHRRAARGGPGERGDRAAVVYRTKQPVLEPRPQRPHGQSSGRHFPIRTQPL
jgi:hypothetical protein